jgi:hypothetical protein
VNPHAPRAQPHCPGETMDPLSAAKLIYKGATVGQKVMKIVGEEPKAITETLAESYRDFVIELGQHLAHHAHRLLSQGEKLDELGARLDSYAEDKQSRRLLNNFAYEAMRETLDARRQMLACATAALGFIDWPVERKARVERVLRQLEVDDVLWLRISDLCCGPAWTQQGQREPGTAVAHVLESSPSREALLSSGTIWIDYKGGGAGSSSYPVARVTRTGLDILEILDAFLRVQPLPLDEIPGRRAIPGSRDRDTAYPIIDRRAPTLRRELPRLARRYRPVFDVTHNAPNQGPPKPDGKSVLRFYNVAPEEAAQVTPTPPDRETENHGGNVPLGDRLVVLVRDVNGVDTKCIEVMGPRDVLAPLADDLRARWA